MKATTIGLLSTISIPNPHPGHYTPLPLSRYLTIHIPERSIWSDRARFSAKINFIGEVMYTEGMLGSDSLAFGISSIALNRYCIKVSEVGNWSFSQSSQSLTEQSAAEISECTDSFL